jgi:hypothetical protein
MNKTVDKMATLRTANFDRLLDVYSKIKNLVKRCDCTLRSAISKISRKLFNLTNWQASNEMYMEYLSYSATRLNILYNSNIDGTIKSIIFKIYNKITALLPDDFQLLLFAGEPEFGWNFKLDAVNWESPKLRYIRNSFWDNLAKVFSRSKNYVKPTISVVSNYIQFSLDLEQCDNATI